MHQRLLNAELRDNYFIQSRAKHVAKAHNQFARVAREQMEKKTQNASDLILA